MSIATALYHEGVSQYSKAAISCLKFLAIQELELFAVKNQDSSSDIS